MKFMENSKPETKLNEEDNFDLLVYELEYEWKRSQPRPTERQLVEIFCPSREMITQNLRTWEKKRLEVVTQMKAALKDIYRIEADAFSHWFGAYIVRLYLQPELEECSRQISRLKRILNILTPETVIGTHQEAVEKARGYPIYDLARERLQLRKSGNKHLALCPFHEEKHASFYLYPETNSFHCFGCQESGDVIKLAMHLHAATFPEAVAMLQR